MNNWTLIHSCVLKGVGLSVLSLPLYSVSLMLVGLFTTLLGCAMAYGQMFLESFIIKGVEE